MKVSVVSTALMLAVAASYAQTAPKGQTGAKGTKMLSSKDKTFMNNSGHSDAAEMELAMLAQKKSKNEKVLEYAKMMIDEHTQMHSELKALAAQRETQVPDAPNAKQKAVKAKLSRLNGMAFDKAYLAANVKGHQEAYANAVKASKTANDAAVRDYFAKGAPKIKSHLDMAKMDAKMPMGGTKSGGMKMGSGR